MSVNAIDGINKLQISKTKQLSFRSNNASTPELKPDTVEISSKQKKKEGMSTGMKLLLGVGGVGVALYGSLVAHRAITRPSLEALQKDFKEIFRRDVTLDEIPEMLKNYKEIMKIKDEKEFCEKAFEQVKKDYGYKDLNIQMILDESTDGILGGGWHSSGSEFRIYYKNMIKHNENMFDKKTKANLLSMFFHEFQHVKQTEYCIRTNIDKYVDAISNEKLINKNYILGINELLKNYEKLSAIAAQKGLAVEQVVSQLNKELEVIKTKGYKAMPEYVKEINKQLDGVRARLNELFGKYEKFKPESEEYKLGERYTENYANYVEAQKDSTNEEYRAQLLEQEAFNAENLSKHIPKRLRSIWNVFSN